MEYAGPTAYLDHAATTPLRPEALEAMLPWLTTHFGNPSGSHAVSRQARAAVDEAREQVADALGCGPADVVFTGGGTEADNLAVCGVVAAARAGGDAGATAVCSATEHHAVLHAVAALGGQSVVVDTGGVIDLDALADRLTPDVALVAVMLANNEVGTVQPLADVAAVVRERAPQAVLHTDAVQAVSWLDLATASDADLVAIAAHKFGGPKGVGALVVRPGVRLQPILHGGGQEHDRRSGTHNVAGIVGMAAALQATVRQRPAMSRRIAALRDRLSQGIAAAVPDVVVTSAGVPRLPNICHVRLPGVDSESLLVLLDQAGVCASAGSACASGALEPSHVLAAMGVARDDALSSLRLSLGWTTTDADVEHATRAVADAVDRLRAPVSP
jgi:cysteine desulfurase